jgi:outer membrane protein
MKTMTLASRPTVAAIGLAFVLALSSSSISPAMAQGHPPPAPPPQGAPVPKILVIDWQSVLRASNAGQDIARQVQALGKTAETELKGEGEGLRKEQETLKQQIAILAPDVKAQKIKAFEAKQLAFQQKVQTRQNQIRYGLALAQRQVETTAAPLLQALMQSRGANLMLDRRAILIGSPGLDVTGAVIQQLNQKLPSVKVQLVTPPPEVLARMQQQQAQ